MNRLKATKRADTRGEGTSLSTGGIIGIVTGVIALVLIALWLIICRYRQTAKSMSAILSRSGGRYRGGYGGFEPGKRGRSDPPSGPPVYPNGPLPYANVDSPPTPPVSRPVAADGGAFSSPAPPNNASGAERHANAHHNGTRSHYGRGKTVGKDHDKKASPNKSHATKCKNKTDVNININARGGRGSNCTLDEDQGLPRRRGARGRSNSENRPRFPFGTPPYLYDMSPQPGFPTRRTCRRFGGLATDSPGYSYSLESSRCRSYSMPGLGR